MSFMDISTSLCFLLFVKLRFLHNLRLNIEKFETLWCPFCVKEWKNSSRYFKVVMKIFTSAGIKNILCQEGDVLEVLAKLFTLALGSINTNQYLVLRKCQATSMTSTTISFLLPRTSSMTHKTIPLQTGTKKFVKFLPSWTFLKLWKYDPYGPHIP